MTEPDLWDYRAEVQQIGRRWHWRVQVAMHGVWSPVAAFATQIEGRCRSRGRAERKAAEAMKYLQAERAETLRRRSSWQAVSS